MSMKEDRDRQSERKKRTIERESANKTECVFR